MGLKQWHSFKRVSITDAELRDYIPGEDISHISISQEDLNHGSPKHGDMIARNPNNHIDQWLVAEQYFIENFERID